MSVNLSIKNVPEGVAESLRRRAERNHRSLQGELMAIVEQAARDDMGSATAPVVAQRAKAASTTDGQEPMVQGWKTVADLLAERRAAGVQPGRAPSGVPLGVDIVRADRDSR